MSVGANLLAAPVVAPVMWLGAIAATLGQVAPALAWLPAWLAGPPLGYLGWLARTAARMPGAEASVALTPVGAAAVYAVAAGAFVGARGPWAPRLRRTTRRTRVAAAMAVVLALGVGAARARGPGPPDGLVVSFLDVGQGDATLIQHGEHAVLVDTGRPGGPIVRRLREAGARRLDVLVLTHASADHDGGAAAVLRAVPVGEVLDGGEVTQSTAGLRAAAAEARARRVARVASDAGQIVRAGPITARVLWPPRSRTAGRDADPNLPRDGPARVRRRVRPAAQRRRGVRGAAADRAAGGGGDEGPAPRQRRSGAARRARASASAGRGDPGGAQHLRAPGTGTVAALRAAVPVVRRTDRDGTVRLHVDAGRMRVDASR